MGTRGALGFVADGTEKITYNHNDSYPGGLGTDVLGWLRNQDPDFLRMQVKALQVVDPDSTPTPEQIKKLRRYAVTDVSTGNLEEWYVLLRHTQGDPAAILDAGYLIDGGEFPADSLYCEYAYVVDTDKGVFEAYRGFQREPHTDGRFAGRPLDEAEQARRIRALGSTYTYYPVRLVASWELTELPEPEAFLAAFNGEDDE